MLQQQFEELTQRYVVKLRDEFETEVGKRKNKEYARKHFRYFLLQKCKYLPWNSIFFDDLIKVFDHFSLLYENEAPDKIKEQIPTIRKKAFLMLDPIQTILLKVAIGSIENDFLYFDALPEIYQFQIANSYSTLNELYELDQEVCSYDDEKLLNLLAMYQATRIILSGMEPVSESESKEQEQISQTKKNKQSQSVKNEEWTRLQQVIFYHYFLRAAGIDESNCSVKVLANLLNSYLGIKTNPKKNSDVYKKLRDPFNQCSKTRTTKDLEYVRSQFEKTNHAKVLYWIDEQIKILNPPKAEKP